MDKDQEVKKKKTGAKGELTKDLMTAVISESGAPGLNGLYFACEWCSVWVMGPGVFMPKETD